MPVGRERAIANDNSILLHGLCLAFVPQTTAYDETQVHEACLNRNMQEAEMHKHQPGWPPLNNK